MEEKQYPHSTSRTLLAIFRNMEPEARKMYDHYLTIRIEEMERQVALVSASRNNRDVNFAYSNIQSYYSGWCSGMSHEIFWYLQQRELLKVAEEQTKKDGGKSPLVYGPDIY